MSMREALEEPSIFGGILPGESWANWRTLLIGALGEPLTAEERAVFTSLTGREREPSEPVDELCAIIGRRGGKTRALSVAASYFAVLVDHEEVRAPGQRLLLPIMAQGTREAGEAFGYLRGVFTEVPRFAAHVDHMTSDTIELDVGVDIQVRPASYRTSRGFTAVAVIADEVAFWRIEGSANPDREILDAVRPTLATTGGPLLILSSPYAKKGELYATYRRHYGPDGDPRVLVAKAPTLTMNTSPRVAREVARAMERDPVAARTEYGAEFREGVSDYISPETLDACTQAGVKEVPPDRWTTYHAFVDPAGGSGQDGMTLAIAHRGPDGVGMLDAVREVSPPFSPESVTIQFAELLKAYRVSSVQGDRYAGEWPRERFREHGITYVLADKSRSEIYQALVPALNSRRVRLLDVPKLRSQLASLERTANPGGRDSIDHPKGHHDDVANAAAGALIRCAGAGGAGLMDLYDDSEASQEADRRLDRWFINQGRGF
ncbi:hypothetical protein [Methylobacterium platani]|nr:hypothetical protein [Methylobacterium platani]